MWKYFLEVRQNFFYAIKSGREFDIYPFFSSWLDDEISVTIVTLIIWRVQFFNTTFIHHHFAIVVYKVTSYKWVKFYTNSCLLERSHDISSFNKVYIRRVVKIR